MHTLPSDRDALHGVRQKNEAGTLRTSQHEIRVDDLQLRFLQSRREFFNGHMSRLSWRPLASQDTDAMSPLGTFATCQLYRAMSAFKGNAEDICSD
jgi:hypothetical protein